MSMDAAIKKNGNYYMQVFLKDENTLKKVIRHIFGGLERSSDDSLHK